MLLTIAVTSTHAQNREKKELTIVDVNGIPRATAQVEETGHILFVLKDSNDKLADDVLVTLNDTHPVEGEQAPPRDEESDEGKALFCDVPAGIWQVSSDVDWVIFTDIEIDPRDENRELDVDCDELAGIIFYGSTGATGGVLLGVLGAGGAATAAVVGYNRSEDDDDDMPLSPSR